MGKLLTDAEVEIIKVRLGNAPKRSHLIKEDVPALLDDREARTRLLQAAMGFINHKGLCKRDLDGMSNTRPEDCDCGAHTLLAEIREAVGEFPAQKEYEVKP